MSSTERELRIVHQRLKNCRKCPAVCGKAVHGPAMDTRLLIVGQAPGAFEESLGKPFAHKAGKTLFKWLEKATGANEETIRELIYFSAVARCFPGKSPTGVGDRPPSPLEIKNCREHLAAEVKVLKPELVIAIGKSAIGEVLGDKKITLNDVVGKKFSTIFHGCKVTVIPLPHPSGVSRWPVTEPGKTLLNKALQLLRKEFSNFV